MSYDQKCYDLAVYFMPNASDMDKNELAQEIQSLIEDFISGLDHLAPES